MTVTQVEAAKQLGVHPNTIAAMLSDGRLTPVVVGSYGGSYRPRRRVDGASLAGRLASQSTGEGEGT